MKIKKYYLIIISSFLFFSCNNSTRIENDLKEQNLHGKVKSINQNTYHAISKFGEISKGERYFNEFLGETANNFSFENSYSEYNKNGYLIKNFAFLKESYVYDNKNKLIEKRYYSADFKTFSLEKFKYDNKGLMIESNDFSNKNLDSLTNKTKYKYDDDGNIIELNQYDSNGELFNKTIKTYKNENLVEMKLYNHDGSISSHFKYVYDKSGNEIEQNLLDELGRTYQKIEAKYNDKNLIISEKNVNGNTNTLKKYVYTKFDSNNNWIERIEYENSKPIYVIERLIKYYK